MHNSKFSGKRGKLFKVIFYNFWHGIPNWCVLDSAIVQDEGYVNEWEIASEFMNNIKAI